MFLSGGEAKPVTLGFNNQTRLYNFGSDDYALISS
jgi:hypothetical protein